MECAPNSIQEWLHSLGVAQYTQGFLDNGYDDLEICKEIGNPDLDAIGVAEKSHRRVILDAVAELRRVIVGQSIYYTLERSHEGQKSNTIVLRNEDDDDLIISDIGSFSSPTWPKFKVDNRCSDTNSVDIRCKSELNSKRPLTVYSKVRLKLLLTDKLLKDEINLAAPPFTDQNGDEGEECLRQLALRYSLDLNTHAEEVFDRLDELRWTWSLAQSSEITLCNSNKENSDKNQKSADRENKRDRDQASDYIRVDGRGMCCLLPHITRFSSPDENGRVNQRLGGPFFSWLNRSKKSLRKRSFKPRKGDLNSSEITMNEDDRMALMMMVKHGRISQDVAVQIVKQYELKKKMSQPLENCSKSLSAGNSCSSSPLGSPLVKSNPRLVHASGDSVVDTFSYKSDSSNSHCESCVQGHPHNYSDTGCVYGRCRSSRLTGQPGIIMPTIHCANSVRSDKCQVDVTSPHSPYSQLSLRSSHKLNNRLNSLANNNNLIIENKAPLNDDSGYLVPHIAPSNSSLHISESANIVSEAAYGSSCLDTDRPCSNKHSKSCRNDLHYMKYAQVIVDYTPENCDHSMLSLKVGDVIGVLSIGKTGLCLGVKNDITGFFHCSNVTFLGPSNNYQESSKSRKCKPRSVEELFNRIGLQQLCDKFMQSNFNTLEKLSNIRDGDLNRMEIFDTEQRVKILTAAEILYGYESDSQSDVVYKSDPSVVLSSDNTSGTSLSPLHYHVSTVNNSSANNNSTHYDSGCCDHTDSQSSGNNSCIQASSCHKAVLEQNLSNAVLSQELFDLSEEDKEVSGITAHSFSTNATVGTTNGINSSSIDSIICDTEMKSATSHYTCHIMKGTFQPSTSSSLTIHPAKGGADLTSLRGNVFTKYSRIYTPPAGSHWSQGYDLVNSHKFPRKYVNIIDYENGPRPSEAVASSTYNLSRAKLQYPSLSCSSYDVSKYPVADNVPNRNNYDSNITIGSQDEWRLDGTNAINTLNATTGARRRLFSTCNAELKDDLRKLDLNRYIISSYPQSIGESRTANHKLSSNHIKCERGYCPSNVNEDEIIRIGSNHETVKPIMSQSLLSSDSTSPRTSYLAHHNPYISVNVSSTLSK